MFRNFRAAFAFTFRLFRLSFTGWSQADAGVHAAAIAYAALFSLAPLVILIFDVLSRFTRVQRSLDSVKMLFPGPVGEALSTLVGEVMRSSRDPITANPIITIATLLILAFGASRLFLQLRRSLNRMYGLAKKPERIRRQTRNFVTDRIFGAVLVLAVGFGFILIITATAALNFYGEALGASNYPVWKALLSLLLSYVANVLVFGLLYRYIPQGEIAWRDLLPGALLTALLYWFGNIAVAIYFVFSRAVLNYGNASFILVLLFWVYVMSMIVLFGAKFTVVYMHMRGHSFKADDAVIVVPDDYFVGE